MLTQFQRESLRTKQDHEWHKSSLLSYGGMMALSRPGEPIRLTAYRDLQIVPSGFVLFDHQSGQKFGLNFAEIQWVSAITSVNEGISTLHIHAEIDQHWLILTLQMSSAEMLMLAKLLQKTISSARSNIGLSDAQPQIISARLADETLQGDLALGAEVQLFVLPHLLVILQKDRVQAKLDMSSVRRVLAVERLSHRLETILPSTKPEGLVRLYSLYDSVTFALSAYRALAQEIGFLARCPVDYVMQEDKDKE